MRPHILLAGASLLVFSAELVFGQLSVVPPTFPIGSMGVPYPEQFLAATYNGDPVSATWRISVPQLPPGLALSAEAGTISGTPTTAGVFSFTVEASAIVDSGPARTATLELSITINPPLAITPPVLPAGRVGVGYAQALSAVGAGVEDHLEWSVSSGSLPPGLVLSSDGILSGTPAVVGSFPFVVQLRDFLPSEQLIVAVRPFTLVITEPPTTVVAITTSPILPAGTVGIAYSQQMTATGGVAPYSWFISLGVLPDGIRLNATTGLISGTPTSSGLFNFMLLATDHTGITGGGAFSITITAPLAISTSSPLPPGALSTVYSATLSATGGTAPYRWSVSAQGGLLPPGLALDLSTGRLTGTPTQSGNYQFLANVTDAAGSTASKSLTLNIARALEIVTTSPLPGGGVGAAYAVQLSATGGIPSYSWSVASGALPGGLSLNAVAGTIGGTPTSIGTFSFRLSVTDQSGSAISGAFVIVVATPVTITSASQLPGGAAGTPYTTTLTAAGGTPPYIWSMKIPNGPMPPVGLTLDPSTGVLAGTPVSGGLYGFTAQVFDADGRTASKAVTITISSALTITTASPLPTGAIGTPYQVQFSATGGTPAYTWSVAAGTLPAGVALNPATGMLSGTPTTGGPFEVTIGVKDAIQNVNKHFSLTITAPALSPVTITGLPDTPTPAAQPQLSINIGAAYSLDLTGHAILSFAPDAGSDDPAIQFTIGGRSADFQIPAGSTQATFTTQFYSGTALGVQTGTVAGTITISFQIFAAGADVTPTPAPTRVLRIAPAPPVITSAKLVANASGFDLLVVGYATTREVTGATVHLSPATGAKLASSDFSIPLTTVFGAWYQDSASIPFGSQFSLTIPFAVQNASSVVASLNVTLANTQGTSTAANATF